MAQSVMHPTLGQVMISSVSSSPAPGSVLAAWSVDPASDSVSLSLSLSLSLHHSRSVSLSLSLSLSLCQKQTLKKEFMT